MSPPSPFSAYQLVRVKSLPSPSVGLATLKATVAAFVNLPIEQGIEAAIWLKPTATGVNFQGIEELLEKESKAPSIYLLANPQTPAISCPEIVSVPVQEGKLAKNELFCLMILPSFWGALVAQQQENSAQYHLHYCFDPSAIACIMDGIRGAIAIADDTPPQLLTVPTPPPPSSVPTLLLAHLLHKQVQTAEVARQAATPPSTAIESAATFFRQGLQELSTTLTRMKTALSLLGSTQLKVLQRQRYLELLQQECDRQNSLLGGMRLLVELDETSPEVIATSVQFADIVPGIVSTYQPLAMEKGIQLGYTLPPGLPPVRCPASWLQQIVVNLLKNSLQWTLAGGKVSVRASQQGEYVQLTFKDTGEGINRHNLTKIFDSFYREGIPAREDSPGAGLGLTIVRQLLWRCGGEISASSKAKKGSVFKVLLPIAETVNSNQ